MRALVVLLLLTGVARAETPDVKGFDHAGHTAGLTRRGKTLACTACHQLGKDGAMKSVPDRKHRPCADAGCHSPWPLPPDRQEAETYCLVCHRKSDVERGRTRPFYPPFNVNVEHTVPFPHARHMAAPGATVALCATCHPSHGEPAGTPTPRGTDVHRTCAKCHGQGVVPAMGSCDGCHEPLRAGLKPPPLPADVFRVTQRFAHVAHAKKSGNDRCSTCHEGLATVRDGAVIPRPSMASCGGCHDGKAAFSVTGTMCNRCHALPPGEKPGEPAPTPRLAYSHAEHGEKGVDQGNCATCHRLDAKWQAEAPLVGKDHAPCSNAGCHGPEFFARRTRICATCHIDARPFAPARFAGLRATSEFGRDFSHLAHVGADASNRTCGRCHQGRFEERPAAQSHAICAPCHAGESRPRMADCQGCHAVGQPRAQLAPRDPTYPWYVRQSFRHETHAADPRGGSETPCLLCHDQVAQARRLAEIGRPRMAQCDACHDGTLAFKTTGFGCSRCHTAGKP